MGDALKSFHGEISKDRLAEIVGSGDIIGVKIAPEYEWINDVVEAVRQESGILEIVLLEEFINQDIMVEDTINCRLIKEDVEYVFETKVTDVGIINPQKVILEVIKIDRFDNARDSKRYTVNLCGRVIYDDGEKSIFATVKNISKTGVAITCRECLGIGEEVDVDIILWKQEVLSAEGRIVRMFKVGKNYKYGIVIENMDKRSQELLVEFVEELEKKESEFIK